MVLTDTEGRMLCCSPVRPGYCAGIAHLKGWRASLAGRREHVSDIVQAVARLLSHHQAATLDDALRAWTPTTPHTSTCQGQPCTRLELPAGPSARAEDRGACNMVASARNCPDSRCWTGAPVFTRDHRAPIDAVCARQRCEADATRVRRRRVAVDAGADRGPSEFELQW